MKTKMPQIILIIIILILICTIVLGTFANKAFNRETLYIKTEDALLQDYTSNSSFYPEGGDRNRNII